MYWKDDWISTARGTDPYCHLSMPYIDLQSALVCEMNFSAQLRRIQNANYSKARESETEDRLLWAVRR